MLLSLLLPLLWAGEWAPEANPRCPDKDRDYKINVMRSVMVQEGLCVLVSCTFSIPNYVYKTDPVYGYWFREGDNPLHDSPVATNKPYRAVNKAFRGRFHLLRDIKNNCSLVISDAKRGDTGSYFFRVERGNDKWSYCGSPVSVNVTAFTHTPNINIPGTLDPGHPSNVTCSVPWACEQAIPPIFSWMSASLAFLGPRTTYSSVLTLTPRPQDHNTNLTCQVTFPGAGVTVERTIQLNVISGDWRKKAAGGEVLVALKGAGVTALLFFCLFLVYFIVKAQRKKASRTTVYMDPIPPAMVPASRDHQQESKIDSTTEQRRSPEEASTLETEQELHYASLSFHNNAPPKDTSTQYSGIRTH